MPTSSAPTMPMALTMSVNFSPAASSGSFSRMKPG